MLIPSIQALVILCLDPRFSLPTFGTNVHRGAYVHGGPPIGGVHSVVREVLVLRLYQVMLRRHQGMVLDHCMNEHRHNYKNVQIPGSLHLQ